MYICICIDIMCLYIYIYENKIHVPNHQPDSVSKNSWEVPSASTLRLATPDVAPSRIALVEWLVRG